MEDLLSWVFNQDVIDFNLIASDHQDSIVKVLYYP